MMETIKDQKEVLINLRSEVNTAETRLKEANRMTEEMEMRRNNAENERMVAEKNTRMIDSKKKELEMEIKTLEDAKVSSRQSQETLQLKVGRLREELGENEDEMFRYW